MLVAKRTIVSVASNIIKAGAAFVTGILIARGLGPEHYGVYAFLLASFSAIKQLLDMGSSSAFYTFISKQNKPVRFFIYYFVWVFIQFSISLLCIVVLAPEEWIHTIWQGESRERIVLAFVAVFLQQHIWQIISQIGESQRLTIRVQFLNLSIAVLHLILIAIMYALDTLSIEYIYYFILIEFTIAALVSFRLFSIQFSTDKIYFPDVFIEFKQFCLPLIPYAWLSMLLGFADTWLLQTYGGAVEQAYFAVAAQFAAISLIVTTSILKILWKEVAEANEKKNLERVLFLYRKANRYLFFVGASISGFIIPWSEDIVLMMLGPEYIEASMVMALMFLYPVHQSLGQINGTMFYALEYTRLYVLIGMFSMFVSIAGAYVMIAPPDAMVPGLGLASVGLALKMVIIQFLTVNFSMWLLSRRMGWGFEWLYQLTNMALCILLGYVIYAVLNTFFETELSIYVRLVSGFAFYLMFLLFVVYLVPSIAGIEKERLQENLEKMRAFFTTKSA